jgi:stage II sporulation protein AA (anti-sigma F factor antagonist)
VSAAESFRAAFVEIDGAAVINVRGEIDLITADALWAAVEQGFQDSSRVVLDLSETTFVDSAGLNLFVRAHHLAGGAPESFILRSPCHQLRRLLDVTSLDKILTIEDDPRPPVLHDGLS